jgi:hypothetical protein
LAGGFVRGELFQPGFVIVMQPAFIVVDEHRGGDVHGVDQNQAFAHAALPQAFLHLRGDIDQPAPGGDVEPEFFAVGFHRGDDTTCGPGFQYKMDSRLLESFLRAKVTNVT